MEMDKNADTNYSYIKENIDHIRNRIKQHGAKPDGTELMAVTKFVDAERINYAIDHCGIRLIGENRVQELMNKYERLHLDGVRVHLIGSLQTNKVKYIIDKVDMIQSLDSDKLASEIDRQAEKCGRRMDCLIEVNIGREPNKGGVLPEEVLSFFSRVKDLPGIRICGLMTIAPLVADQAEQMRYFTETKVLFDQIAPQLPLSGDEKPILSMGMSDSMGAAIAAGSSMIRIGTAIFGKRL